MTSVKRKVTQSTTVPAPEQEPQAWKPKAGAPGGAEGDGGKEWEFSKVKSIFLRDSVDQLTAGVRGHIYAPFPGHVTVTSAC